MTFLVLVAVVAASFWISFQLGKRILLPVKKFPERKIEVAISEPPPSIQALQKALSAEVEKPPVETPEAKKSKPAPVRRIAAARHYYKVQAGLYVDKVRAQALAEQVKAGGFDIYLKKVSTGWRVQVGAFRTRNEAEALQSQLSGKGFKSTILYE